MRFGFKPSFNRSVKIFHGEEKEKIKKAAKQAVDVLSVTSQILVVFYPC